MNLFAHIVPDFISNALGDIQRNFSGQLKKRGPLSQIQRELELLQQKDQRNSAFHTLAVLAVTAAVGLILLITSFIDPNLQLTNFYLTPTPWILLSGVVFIVSLAAFPNYNDAVQETAAKLLEDIAAKAPEDASTELVLDFGGFHLKNDKIKSNEAQITLHQRPFVSLETTLFGGIDVHLDLQRQRQTRDTGEAHKVEGRQGRQSYYAATLETAYRYPFTLRIAAPEHQLTSLTRIANQLDSMKTGPFDEIEIQVEEPHTISLEFHDHTAQSESVGKSWDGVYQERIPVSVRETLDTTLEKLHQFSEDPSAST